MKLGDFISIGRDCIIEAAQIGSGTEIQDDCIIVSDLVDPALTAIRWKLILSRCG